MFRRQSMNLLLALAVLAFLACASTRADDSKPEEVIKDLFEKNKLFVKAEYKTVRGAFAKRFEQKHQDTIKRAYGNDYDAITKWLNENADIKEEFYTAIDEKHDNIEVALKIFKEIHKQFPDKIKTYSHLAIATAVTWDDPRKGIYDYRHHGVRCKSTLPKESLDGLENFKYVVEHEKELKGYGQYLPWEFLAHVVNHATPRTEREWALKNYINRRPMFGQCYKQVEYDQGMLRGQTPKLAGHDYTLENILKYGGVCAMQADYAARVGKSMAVPAEYVWGQANNGVLHAWVMWVELKQVSKTQITFSLESFGRYNVDQYYTGKLNDPQTGQEILDRDMELRLSMVGYDQQGKRHAALTMKAYPLLREKLAEDASAHVAYFNKVLTLCPWNEDCWLALAKLSRDGVLKKEHTKAVLIYLDKLFTTFGKFPDFTWKVIDDLLLVIQDDTAQRTKTYERLVGLYEGADRPDLACQARLKLAGFQMDGMKFKEAATGLASTIQKFPGEGRYIPKLMDKLEEACKKFKGGTDVLARFYLDVLPRVPAKRGDEPSKHCIAMHEKALAFFKENKKDKEAALVEKRLAEIK